MQSRLLGAVCASAISVVPLVANAALIEVDWKTPGDKLITRDTSTRIEWLDVTVTANRSYNDISSTLGSGGEFYGFHYASRSNVETLLANAGVMGFDSHGNSWDPIVFQNATIFMNLVGVTLVSADGDEVTAGGITGDVAVVPANPQLKRHWSSWIRTVSSDGRTDHGQGIWSDFSSDPALGHWLIKPTAVPIPPAVWLFGSGLLGLVAIARRRVQR